MKKLNYNQPSISVLMPALNAEKYIVEAIQSILNQTFQNFELLILNDGSSDRTESLIQSFQDERIHYMKNEKNEGLTFSRNKLIENAKGKYIAWNDADDLSAPDRFQLQFHYLESHPEDALAASWAKIIDAKGNNSGDKIISYLHKKDLAASLLFVNTLVQSSVMIRKSVLLENNYDPQFPPTEDYELWVRIAQKYPIKIISNYLSFYRHHDSNISFTKSALVKSTIQLNHQNQLSRLGIQASPAELNLHYQIGFEPHLLSDKLKEVELWLTGLLEKNQINRIFNHFSLARIISHRWIKTCLANNQLSKWAVLKICIQSPIYTFSVKSLLLFVIFLLKNTKKDAN